MSRHLVAAAGYLDIPEKHKLALMKIADSADHDSRIGFPGIEAIRAWTGAARSAALGMVSDLQKWGLLMQVEAGHKGRRASYKVFPDAGDETASLTFRQGRLTPGVAAFKGVPTIPSDEELAARHAAADVRRAAERAEREAAKADADAAKGSDSGRTQRQEAAPPKGPTQAGPFNPPEGPVQAGPSETPKGPAEDPKGSRIAAIGSSPDRTPSSTSTTRTTTTNPLADPDASTGDGDQSGDGLFAAPPSRPVPAKKATKPKKAPDPTSALAQEITSEWWDALEFKPAGVDAFRNARSVVVSVLKTRRSPDDIRAAMAKLGPSVSTGRFNYQFSLIDEGRKPQTHRGGHLRPAQSNQKRWEDDPDFFGKEAS